MVNVSGNHDGEEKTPVTVTEPLRGGRSFISSDEDRDSIREASRDLERQDIQRSTPSEKRGPRVSQDMRRTVSNVLSQIASRITTRSLPEPPPPPDGGLKAWTQVAMGFLVIFTTWGYVNAFGAFQAYYTETMPDTAPSAISWIGSIQIFLSLFLGVFTGRFLDAGYFLPAYIIGATLQVVGVFLMSISTKYWHLLLTQGVLTGLGNGIFFTPTMALCTTYFSKRRGLAVGLITMGNSGGGAIYPVITRQLLPTIGFAWTARVLGLINLCFLLLAGMFLRPRLPPRKSGPLVDLSAFKEPVFVGLVAGMFFAMWANYYTFYYIVSYAREVLGLPYSTASILIIILNGVGIPFRLIVPLCADRFGPLTVLVPLLCIWCTIAFCWLAVKDVAGYYVFTCFYAATSGGFQSVIPTSIASITPRLNMVGTRLGMGFGITAFAALTGPPIGGALQGADGGKYIGPQAWAASVTFVAFVSMLVSRTAKGGWTLKTRC